MSLSIRIPGVSRFVVCILLAMTLSSSSFANWKCPRLESYDLADVNADYQSDLQSHVWRSDLFGEPARIYFQNDGIAYVIPDKSARVETYTWELSLCTESAFLQLFYPEGVKQFVISPTCNGLSVVSKGMNNALLLDNEAELSKVREEFLEGQITGSWVYSPNHREVKSGAVPFVLALKGDGTYELKQGPDIYHSSQHGVWQLSPDGDYLILFVQPISNDTISFIAESIRIQTLEYNSLVIDGQVLPRIMQSGKKGKPMSLVKAG